MPEESFTQLATTSEPAAPYVPNRVQHQYSYGRVIDAVSGKPVVGAVVESWTEELNNRLGKVERIGEALSGEDGRFRILQGGKARIHAPGYLIWNGAGAALGCEDIPLFRDPGPIPTIKVIDTHGRPIYNAVITSTLTCSHDVPAFEARTNTDGIAYLRGYGAQEKIPELRLRAVGFAGTEYINGEHTLLDGYDLTVVMPRMERKIQAQILMADGSPYSFGPYQIFDGDCYHAGMTTEEGWITSPYRYLANGILVNPLGEIDGPEAFGDLDLIPDRPVSLRQISWDWPEDIDQSSIKVQLPDLSHLDEKYPKAQLIHSDGWTKSIREKEWKSSDISFPSGQAALHLGGSFRAFEEEWIEFNVGPGESIELQPEWKPQTKVELAWPEGVSAYWVEAGSFTSEVNSRNKTLFYPTGERVVFHGWDEDGNARYWEANAPKGVVDISTLNELPLVQMGFKQSEVQINKIHIHLPEWFEGKSSWWEDCMLTWEGNPEVQPTDDPHKFTLEVPDCSPAVVTWNSQGYMQNHFVIQPGQTDPVYLEPKKFASVEINCEAEFEVSGFFNVGDLKELPPGPTHLVLQFEDGRRVGMKLNLEPGEQRKITVVAE